ncbi:hypothetical protein T11_16751 [Trichinella zimbabwensis]|uniref:Uncharacterized protein n=1 Tax=Trichinella zimbabwensis TaxID=268475 RepID=A0A0V1GUU5_9BILA|nr:hypothetical protein T11_16751 [Trichinella zimbabwensis]
MCRCIANVNSLYTVLVAAILYLIFTEGVAKSYSKRKPITNVDCFIQNGCEPLKRTQGHVGLR